MRVLVTGASGFIGRWCHTILLEKGYQVIPLDRTHYPRINLLKEFDYTRDFIREVQADLLIHTAWDIGPDYKNSKKNLEWVASSLNLVKCFHEAGGQRALTLGSCLEYGGNGPYYNEDYPNPLPDNLYGLAKLSMYQLLRKYSGDSGLSYVHPRLFYLYGPNDRPTCLVPAVARGLLLNETVKCYNENQHRDYLYVEDAAEAVVTILSYPGIFNAINVGSGIGKTVKEVTQFISAYLNKVDKIIYDNENSNNVPPFMVANLNKYNKEVGYIPKYTFEGGLAKTLEWIKSQ